MSALPTGVVLSIGEELLEGRVLDTNSQCLSRELLSLGVQVRKCFTLGDVAGDLHSQLEDLRGQVQFVVSSGGLGPTADDRVRAEVSAFLDVPLEPIPEAIAPLRAVWARAHEGEPPDSFLNQAHVPLGATPIRNRVGTAWGFSCDLGQGTHLFCLPGPPQECRSTFFEGGGREELEVLLGGEDFLALGTFHTTGLPESKVEALVHDLMTQEGNPRMGITASPRKVSISVMAWREPGGKSATEVLEGTAAKLRTRLGDLLWGRDGQTLERVVVGELLQRGETVATAESCTGGLLAATLTKVSGASEVFGFGWSTYSNQAKMAQLGVDPTLLERHGAVSQEVAYAMAEGARKASGSTWAISATGIAGPSGGTEGKPVGTVFLGLAGPKGSFSVHRRQFSRAGREGVQLQTVRDCLELLRRELKGLPRLPSV